MSSIHLAARQNEVKNVANLLAADPNSSTVLGRTALHFAAGFGHEQVVELLLKADQKNGLMVDPQGDTALHYAIVGKHDKVVTQLLKAHPELVDVANSDGWTAGHFAVYSGREAMLDQLLALRPDLIKATDHSGNSILHLAVRSSDCLPELAKVWRMYPEALHMRRDDKTPFQLAVDYARVGAVEVLQKGLTYDEIFDAFQAHEVFLDHLGLVLEEKCECLSEHLLPDLKGIILDYLGFESNV